MTREQFIADHLLAPQVRERSLAKDAKEGETMNDPNAPAPRLSILDFTLDRIDRVRSEVETTLKANHAELVQFENSSAIKYDIDGLAESVEWQVVLAFDLDLYQDDDLNDVRRAILASLRKQVAALEAEWSDCGLDRKPLGIVGGTICPLAAEADLAAAVRQQSM
jgi:hypothetical protein